MLVLLKCDMDMTGYDGYESKCITQSIFIHELQILSYMSLPIHPTLTAQFHSAYRTNPLDLGCFQKILHLKILKLYQFKRYSSVQRHKVQIDNLEGVKYYSPNFFYGQEDTFTCMV